jgi:hypothetical protein
MPPLARAPPCTRVAPATRRAPERATAPSFRQGRSRRPAWALSLRSAADCKVCPAQHTPLASSAMLHTQRSPACETLRHHARTCPELPTASRSYRDRVDLRSAPRSRAPAHQPSAIGFASGMRRPRRSSEARRPHAVSRGPGAVNTPLRQGHKSGRDGPIEAPHWALPSSHPHVRTKARARCVVAR